MWCRQEKGREPIRKDAGFLFLPFVSSTSSSATYYGIYFSFSYFLCEIPSCNMLSFSWYDFSDPGRKIRNYLGTFDLSELRIHGAKNHNLSTIEGANDQRSRGNERNGNGGSRR